MKDFKIIHGDEIRVVSLSMAHLTYPLLKEKVSILFPHVRDTSILYKDIEGDYVTIFDDDSLRAAVVDAENAKANSIRFILKHPRQGSESLGSAHNGCHEAKCGTIGKSRHGPCRGSLWPLGVGIGLRMLGVSWCTILGLGLLRCLFKHQHGNSVRGRRRDQHRHCPSSWFNVQTSSPFHLATPFFTVSTTSSTITRPPQVPHDSHPMTRQYAPKRTTASTSAMRATLKSTPPAATSASKSPGRVESAISAQNPNLLSDSEGCPVEEAPDVVTEDIVPYTVDVDGETDTVTINPNAGVADTYMDTKVDLIKNMGFDLDENTIRSLMKEMNGRLDLIVSALLKNSS